MTQSVVLKALDIFEAQARLDALPGSNTNHFESIAYSGPS